MAIFLALVVVPIIEIALFIEVGGWLGLWPTLGIVVLTALIGTVLLRSQGMGAMATLRRNLERGEDPRGAIANGALILVAGIVLLTPGFFTDAIGLSLLLPPVRAVVIGAISRRVAVMASARGPAPGRGPGDGPPPDARGETVEAQYEDVTDKAADTGDAPAHTKSGWTSPPGRAGKGRG